MAIVLTDGDDAFIATDDDDEVFGGAGNDTLSGGRGNDLIFGGPGNDYFDWVVGRRSGDDTFHGGPGDDVYVIADPGDVVVELPGEGFDFVWIPAHADLADFPNVEGLGLYGFEPTDATGNDGPNRLIGSEGSNVLRGLGGNDTLDGRAGFDILHGDAGNDTLYGSTDGDTLFGGDGDDFLCGDDDPDIPEPSRVPGAPGNDQLFGEAGNDTLFGGGGSDLLDGGAGLDVARFANARAAYTVTLTGPFSATVSGGGEGTDTLASIERLVFADSGLARDVDGNAGDAVALLHAAFGLMPPPALVSPWIAEFDAGGTMTSVAAAMIGFYVPGGVSNAVLVNALYTNVVGVAPNASESAFWVGILDRGELSQPQVFALAADYSLNREKVAVLTANGIPYDPWLI